MPAPVAKGIIIGVSVLVAAGIAVYESPQFQRWVRNSRRKIATALHHLGDEISPSEASILQDISMTEDAGAAAVERREKAREELLQRRQLLEDRRRSTQSGDGLKGRSGSGSSAATSFDSLVDGNGRLRSETVQGDDTNEAVDAATSARSTAIETDSITMELVQRRRLMQSDPAEDLLYERRASQEALGQLHPGLAIPPPFSDVSSHHPSESLVDLTPTSEFPEAEFVGASMDSSAARSPQGQTEPPEYFSVAPLPAEPPHQTESQASEYYYARPSEGGVQSPGFSSIEEAAQSGAISPASSVFGSTSHTEDGTFSDGTPSEWEHESSGVATPASWSEVGSVLSSDDGHHE